MNKLRLAILAISATIHSAAVAAPVWVTGRHITYIYPVSNGMMINLDGTAINPTPGCTPPNSIYLLSSTANYEVMASALMLAFSQGSSVDIYYENANLAACNPPMYQFIVYR